MILMIGGGTVVGVIVTANTGDFTWLFVSLPFTLVLLVFSRFAPSGYRLARDGVHVERRAGDVVIPYAAVQSVDTRPRPVAGLTFAGSNGLFGRFGRFWNPRVGVYRLYTTNTHAIVWLATSAGLIGLSPDRPGQFVERLERRLAGDP